MAVPASNDPILDCVIAPMKTALRTGRILAEILIEEARRARETATNAVRERTADDGLNDQVRVSAKAKKPQALR